MSLNNVGVATSKVKRLRHYTDQINFWMLRADNNAGDDPDYSLSCVHRATFAALEMVQELREGREGREDKVG